MPVVFDLTSYLGHAPLLLRFTAMLVALPLTGDAFALHSMHFKLGLYEHQSAGAIQALVDLFARVPELAADRADRSES